MYDKSYTIVDFQIKKCIYILYMRIANLFNNPSIEEGKKIVVFDPVAGSAGFFL